MRQTRRSRSAATPQKDEAPPQTEDVKESVKANLETVFEKDGDTRDDTGAAVESSTHDAAGHESASATLPSESEASLQDETNLLEETVSNSEDMKSEVVGSTPCVGSSSSKTDASSPLLSAASPKVGQTPLRNSEVIELNCKVCNCSFTNYQEHMTSDAHKSKISHSSPKTDGSNNDKTPTPNQAQKRAGDQALDSTPSAKRMKNQNQTPQNTPDKFRCDVCNATMAKQQDYDIHMNGKRHLVNVTRAQGKAYCDICKLFFNTLTDFNDHTDSQLHKTNVANRKTEREQFECKLCNISVQGKRQYEQHLSSKRHKRFLTSPAAVKKPAAAPVPTAATTPATSATTAAAAATVNGKSESNAAESQKKWLYICNACNFGCNQDQQFSSHMNLADHKAAAIDMKKKGLVKDQGITKLPPVKAPAPKPAPVNNAAQNVRKFPHNAAGGPRNFAGPQGVGNRPQNFVNKPGPNQGPVTKVTYNVVPGNVNAGGQTGVPPKQGPMKKDGPQANRKGPPGGPVGPNALGAPVGPKKAMPLNKPNMPVNKPPMSGRLNPRFGGQGENQQNKFPPNAQPIQLGFQKMAFDGPGNFGSHAFGNVGDANNAGGNFGNYGQRQPGTFVGNMRNDNINQTSDVRGDFRGNIRDDYRSDIRDLRDIRNIDMGMDNRGDSNFRSGYYRDMPVDSARDNRNDYSNFRGGDMSVDARADMRSGLAADARGDMRGLTRNDMSADIRSFNSDMRDMRTDSRNDFMRDRNTNYGGASSFGQQNYRGTDDYRSDNYSRGSQLSSQATSSGGYSGGMMSSGRYDSSFMDRNSSSAYNNQYAGQSRGMGYMGDMTLNGR